MRFGVATLAASTSRARVGCLVYFVAYRSAAVLAHAAATLDLLSGGRAFPVEDLERFAAEVVPALR